MQCTLDLCGRIAGTLAVLVGIAMAGGSDDLNDQNAIERLASEFRKLRMSPGHFDGHEWNDDVDRWMGLKHRLMMALGDLLGTGDYEKAGVVRLLGAPDQIARPGDAVFTLISKLPAGSESTDITDEYLVYYWRGQHDFLFFSCRDGLVISSGWWYAGE